MRKGILFFVFYFLFFSHSSFSQTSVFLDSLLKVSLSNYSPILEQPNKYKLQIIYTQINRDKNNQPSFKNFKYHTYKNYFYPASTVKLPISVVALIKMQELRNKGIDVESPMITDSAFYCQKKIGIDTTTDSDYPTLGNYIRKMLLVSDNPSCARAYEFVGCDYLHDKLEEMGYKNIRVLNRLDGQCPGDTSKITPPIYFLGKNKDTLYRQYLTLSEYKKMHPIPDSKSGKGHVNSEGKKVWIPKDFSRHNYFPLVDLHDLMKRIVFNDYLPEKEKLPLTEENRHFLIKYLGMYPKESRQPYFDRKIFYDSFKKYFMYGNAAFTIKGDSVRIFNIVGRAYGFLIDCAYIVDFKNKTEFLLTASVYVNEKDMIGGGRYEYETLGLPFLNDLSKTIYRYERSRAKENLPDLNEFNLFGYH